MKVRIGSVGPVEAFWMAGAGISISGINRHVPTDRSPSSIYTLDCKAPLRESSRSCTCTFTREFSCGVIVSWRNMRVSIQRIGPFTTVQLVKEPIRRFTWKFRFTQGSAPKILRKRIPLQVSGLARSYLQYDTVTYPSVPAPPFVPVGPPVPNVDPDAKDVLD